MVAFLQEPDPLPVKNISEYPAFFLAAQLPITCSIMKPLGMNNHMFWALVVWRHNSPPVLQLGCSVETQWLGAVCSRLVVSLGLNCQRLALTACSNWIESCVCACVCACVCVCVCVCTVNMLSKDHTLMTCMQHTVVPVTHLFLANMFSFPFCHSMQGLVSLLNSDSICVGWAYWTVTVYV